MANQEHLTMLKQGVGIWNKWRQEQQDVIPDLSGANLDQADLSKADLSGANLSLAQMSHADLSKAKLDGAKLIGADLSKARLDGAELDGAKLSYAYLKGAIGISLEELEKKAKSLQDATMPDGSKHS